MSLATPLRRMPVPERVGEFLSDLVGRSVIAESRAELDLDAEDAVLYSAVFIDDDGDVAGACVADLDFAAYSGASLAMIPKPVAAESIAAGELSETLSENFHEVANIVTALLNGPSSAHLKIRDVVTGVPEEVRALVLRAAGRRQYVVTVNDYGSGSFALYAA
jgi:hypothetical protein